MFAIYVLSVLSTGAHAQSGTLPSGWSNADIGSTTAGATTSANGTWNVTGGGANVWGTADEFQFAYRQVSGDFDVSAQISAFDPSNEWAKAGIMVRDALTPNARNVFALLSPGIGHAMQQRATAGGSTTRVDGRAAQAPTWVRLVRQGTRFTAYGSADGQTWTTVSTATLSLPASTYVGLAVTSREPAATADATFSNVAFEVSATDAAAVAWASRDIGTPPLAGSWSLSGGTHTVAGNGADVFGTTDQFHYAYQPVTGDVEIVARIASFSRAADWSKAGVMIRQSLNANSQNAFMILSGEYGFLFQRRMTAGGESDQTGGPSGVAPGWVRLVREGNLFSAYHSTNGSSWTLVDTDTIPMTGTIYVGLGVTSHSTGARATATFTNVTIGSPSAGANKPPTVTLTAPASNASFTAPATIAMTASASDTDGQVSRVEFYRGSTLISSDTTSPYTASWANVPAGTYSLTAKAIDDDGATTTSAAVSVRVTGSGNTAPTVSFTSPSNGATFTAPATILLTATASDPGGSIARVELYRDSTLLKNDTTSPYSHSWTNVAAGTYQLRAVAYDNAGASQTATMTVTVNPAGNQIPSVAITSPAAGASFTAPANVTVQATASDSDGTVARVEFYRGSTLIASDTTSPYSATWTGATAGTHSLTAKAIDNKGGTRTSSAVSITVGSASNQLPTVSITSPTAGASYTAPGSVTINANASDSDGSIARVDFYAGSQLIGTDTSSPYSAAWTNVAQGSYSLTAVARDNTGATRTSTAVNVTVAAAASTVTRVAFNASSDHSTNVNSYVVALRRSGDAVTASPVATRDLGKPAPASGVITVDISTLVNPLAAGSYYAVVSAVGPGGTTTSSASAAFTK